MKVPRGLVNKGVKAESNKLNFWSRVWDPQTSVNIGLVIHTQTLILNEGE